GIRPSRLRGAEGNQEFFVRGRFDAPPRGVQGGVAAPRTVAEGDELRIPPGSSNTPKEWTTTGKEGGVQGGVAAPRTVAEGDELRIPPGSSNTPKEWTTTGNPETLL